MTADNKSVVHVLPHLRPGGLREVVLRVDQDLPTLGVRSSIVDLDSSLRTLGSGGRRVSTASVRLSAVLVRRWRSRTPDAVLAHTVGGAVATLGLALVSRVPLRVLVIHAGRSSLGPVKTLVARLLLRVRVANRVVFVGAAAAASFGAMGSSSGARVIRNGVPAPGRDPQVSGLLKMSRPDRGDTPGSRPLVRVVSVGRLVPSKRVDLAVNAVRLSTSPVQLVVCGSGPEETTLLGLAAGSDHIQFRGEVTRDEVEQELARSDVFIFPSEVEGLPLVLLEAARAGAALLLRDTDFNREVAGDAALYVPSDHPSAWASALDRLCIDASMRDRLRQGAVERVRAFPVSAMVRGYADLVNETPQINRE